MKIFMCETCIYEALLDNLSDSMITAAEFWRIWTDWNRWALEFHFLIGQCGQATLSFIPAFCSIWWCLCTFECTETSTVADVWWCLWAFSKFYLVFFAWHAASKILYCHTIFWIFEQQQVNRHKYVFLLPEKNI